MRLVYFWVVFLPILLRLGSLSQEKGDRKVSLFLMWLTGLEEGGTANGGAKNMPATYFFAGEESIRISANRRQHLRNEVSCALTQEIPFCG